MEDEKYFLVTVVLQKEQDNGGVKKYTEKYLVEGYTYTDVEATIIKEFEGETMEYSIKSMNDSKIIKVIKLKK